MAKHAQLWGFIAGIILAFGLGWWGFARAGSNFSPEPDSANGTFDTAPENPVKALNQWVQKHNAWADEQNKSISEQEESLDKQEQQPDAQTAYLEAQKESLEEQRNSPDMQRLTPGSEAVRCIISSFGLLRFYDLYQPGAAPWQLFAAQFLVPGVALFGAWAVFLVGVRKNLRTVMARHKSSHTIICGIGDVGMQVVENLRKPDKQHKRGLHLVAVDLHDDSPAAATCEKSGVLVVQGDAKNPQVLRAAGIHRAQKAIISTGSDSENIDIALQIQDIYARTPNLKPASIQVLAQLRNDWMHKRLLGSVKSLVDSAVVDLRLFNPFTDAARLLIKQLRLPPSPEFDAHTFVLVGFGRYGREMALHLIRSSPVPLGQKLKILVFDEKAVEAKKSFSVTYPAALELASVEFVKAMVCEGSPDLTRVVEPKLEAAGPLLGIALAMGDDQASLSAALEVRSILDRIGHLHVPIYVRLEYYRRLGKLVRDMENISSFGDRVQIFGTLEETLSKDVLLDAKLDLFAQALHTDWLARASKNSEADKPWHNLPEVFKMSNRWRADHSPLLMQLVGMHLHERSLTAVASPAAEQIDEESPAVATLGGQINEKSPAVATLSGGQIEQLAQLEHRRYVIERRMVENRPRSAWRDDPNLYDWKDLDEGSRDYNRKEVARLPQIMAGLGIELLPVRTVRVYGEHRMAQAAKEIDALLAAPKSAHWNLIIDVNMKAAVFQAKRALDLLPDPDDDEAKKKAAQAAGLPSISFWLVSAQLPREYSVHKVQNKQEGRAKLFKLANGWAAKSRLSLVE